MRRLSCSSHNAMPCSESTSKAQLTEASPAPSVAVIGAGIAGSSVALALCKLGVQVHLYDCASGPQRVPLATGWVRFTPTSPVVIRLCRN